MTVKEKSIDIINQLKDFTSILDSYKKEYESVNIKISDKLPEIESHINKNIESVLNLKKLVHTGENDSSSNNEQHELLLFNDHLNSVIKTLVESKDIDQSIFKDLKETINILNSSILKIKDIDNISENLKVFAINSIVYAQQAGTKGKGYQLISGQFIKLSEDLSKSTISINNIGDKLNKQILLFLNKIEIHNEYSLSNIEQLSYDSKELIDNSNRSIMDLITVLDSSVNHISSVKEPTSQIMLILQKQDIIHQQMEHIHETLIEMTELLEANFMIFEENNSSSDEFLDLFTLLNFLLVTTEKQIKRINNDLLSMIDDMEEPLNKIIETISRAKIDKQSLGHEYGENRDISELIHIIFSKPLTVINDIVDKLNNNKEQKTALISRFEQIDELMILENSMAKDFIPQMDMIKNLLFLAHVEQERNQLDIVLDLDDKNSIFSNSVFEKMNDIIDGVSLSQKLVTDNLQEFRNLFIDQEKKYYNIEENLNSSRNFLKKTGELFNTNFSIQLDITHSLYSEVKEYREFFAKIRELHNNMNKKIHICTDLKNNINKKLQASGGIKNLNECSYRDTIIRKILDHLTVDEERVTILEEFPELDIEKTTGSSVTLF